MHPTVVGFIPEAMTQFEGLLHVGEVILVPVKFCVQFAAAAYRLAEPKR